MYKTKLLKRSDASVAWWVLIFQMLVESLNAERPCFHGSVHCFSLSEQQCCYPQETWSDESTQAMKLSVMALLRMISRTDFWYFNGPRIWKVCETLNHGFILVKGYV